MRGYASGGPPGAPTRGAPRGGAPWTPYMHGFGRHAVLGKCSPTACFPFHAVGGNGGMISNMNGKINGEINDKRDDKNENIEKIQWKIRWKT